MPKFEDCSEISCKKDRFLHRKISGPWLPRITFLDFDLSLNFRHFGKKVYHESHDKVFFYHMQKTVKGNLA